MDLGDTLRFSTDVEDGAGALVNAQSVSLTITLPDGTTATPTVTNPPATTGKYYYDYVTTLASPQGRYVGAWLLTFAGGATTSYVETFDVGASLVTVDEALAHLRAAGVITTAPDLDQLQWLTFVATDAVERDLDLVLVKRTITETHNGNGRPSIILRKSPVISVSSVVENGVTLTSGTDYVARLSSGIIYRGGQLTRSYFTYGIENVAVTYVAGYNNPPPCIRYAALGIIQGMWQESQQSFHPGVEVDGLSGIALAAPTNTVSELQRAYNSLRASRVG